MSHPPPYVPQEPVNDPLEPPDEIVDPDGPTIRAPFHRRILLSTAPLPVLLTLGNALSGFAAIHFATRNIEPDTPHVRLLQLAYASWFIIASMVFDMLDGQMARLTRRTSDFGAQLDSLCDAISFGAAPGVLVLQTISLWTPASFLPPERLVWAIGAIYVACAVLRLARFNVEHETTDTPHLDFTGLPSPAAAFVVISLVLLANDLHDRAWATPETLTWGLAIALPVFTLAAGLLMVSRVPYPHLANRYVRGRKPLSFIVRFVVIAVAALLEPYITLAALSILFMLSGPVNALWHRRRRA